ncbi:MULTISPECIES: FkbM family methyltransferase [Flavobacterium]|uniref:FkbM family methyltransferase n=1 Tax=Flavobacterium jumunjinense TaxID=998845 RepID=A0ABV5GJL2_9FLAO|nr:MULTISPECIES: FkbM family methyltransferase [Flavobacterium]
MKLVNKIYKIIFAKKIKKREIKFYSNIISNGDLCFDIGANIGAKSKIMLNISENVIAFEPQKSCHLHLEKLKQKNVNFNYLPYAVGAKNEIKKLYLGNYSEIASLSKKFIKNYTTEKVYWKDYEFVEVKSFNHLIETYGLPKYCKIDVEGYEFEILSNLNYQIPIIEFEFTGKLIADTLKIIDLFKNQNIDFNYTLNENQNFHLKKWIKNTEIKEIIKGLPIKNLHGNLFCKNPE